MKRPELICFDFDGTLCNTLPDITASMNTVLQRFGYPGIPEGKVRDFIGSGIPKLVERSLRHAISGRTDENIDTALLERMGREMSEHYGAHLTERSHLYPGVPETLEALAGIPLALVSNKPQAMLRDMTEYYGIRSFFDLIVGGDTLDVAKPDPAVWHLLLEKMQIREPLYGWMIGDSLPDVRFGKVGGLTNIVVSYGYNDVPLLLEAGAEIVIGRLSELPDMISSGESDK